jgi:hypothetical protein
MLVNRIIERRLRKDRPFSNPTEKFALKEISRSLSSPHVLLLLVIFFMIGTEVFGLAYFLASIVRQLGFSATKSQLLSVGPFATGCVGRCFVNQSECRNLMEEISWHSNPYFRLLVRQIQQPRDSNSDCLHTVNDWIRCLFMLVFSYFTLPKHSFFCSHIEQICCLWISLSHSSWRVFNGTNHGSMDG